MTTELTMWRHHCGRRGVVCGKEAGCGGLVLQIELFEPFEYFGPEYVANKLVPGWISYPAGTLTVKLDTGNRSMEHK